MLRYLLVLLAVLVAVLAYLFDRPWLWVGAGVIFAGGVSLLLWRAWSAYSEADEGTEPAQPEPESPEESLEELGIMDIRPHGAEGEASGSSAETVEEREPADPPSDETAATPGDRSAEHPATRSPEETTTSEVEESAADGEEAVPSPSSGLVVSDDAAVLGPLLLSLRAALDAETVCLLVQEEVALTYRIEVLASRHADVRTSGTFDTQTPLLTASMSRHAVGIRSLPETELAIEDLGYYDSPPRIDHLAVAPVPRPDDPSTTFLLADATKGTDLGASQARSTLKRFAQTLDVLLPPYESELGPVSGPDAGEGESEVVGPSSEPGADVEPGEEARPRPRHEIIAEEIEAAEAEAEDLALILVHLNRAESIARRGDEAVASAERLLRARLDQMALNQRVERFGELTYGVFFRGDADAVEPWVADLEAAMDREEGELEGGVSVGVAVRGDHDAKTLRTDATEALHEAYKTGTSTIVA